VYIKIGKRNGIIERSSDLSVLNYTTNDSKRGSIQSFICNTLCVCGGGVYGDNSRSDVGRFAGARGESSQLPSLI